MAVSRVRAGREEQNVPAGRDLRTSFGARRDDILDGHSGREEP
ncbi:hypothetical protein ACFORO_10530 [Amycolatopsis halotolerans]|uniref:Uncharacterized protein n=1 Tax=Amycolatopsis halotolerans TaxID=330083 RepID=A0ABV7QE25_9PSEU